VRRLTQDAPVVSCLPVMRRRARSQGAQNITRQGGTCGVHAAAHPSSAAVMTTTAIQDELVSQAIGVASARERVRHERQRQRVQRMQRGDRQPDPAPKIDQETLDDN
jgi:hypothetical protein